MKNLINLIIDLFAWAFDLIKRTGRKVFEKFLDINLFEKGIVLCTALSFAAVVAPMAKYMIFDTYFTINNPSAHYLIGITMVMLVTVYFPGPVTLAARVLLNLLYLADIVYLQAAHEISRAPYHVTAGYYLNIICPALYIILAAGSALLYRES